MCEQLDYEILETEKRNTAPINGLDTVSMCERRQRKLMMKRYTKINEFWKLKWIDNALGTSGPAVDPDLIKCKWTLLERVWRRLFYCFVFILGQFLTLSFPWSCCDGENRFKMFASVLILSVSKYESMHANSHFTFHGNRTMHIVLFTF